MAAAVAIPLTWPAGAAAEALQATAATSPARVPAPATTAETAGARAPARIAPPAATTAPTSPSLPGPTTTARATTPTTSPRGPIVPPNEPSASLAPHPYFYWDCALETPTAPLTAKCVADAQQSYADARAQEGLGLLGLPSDFASLTQAEQNLRPHRPRARRARPGPDRRPRRPARRYGDGRCAGQRRPRRPAAELRRREHAIRDDELGG